MMQVMDWQLPLLKSLDFRSLSKVRKSSSLLLRPSDWCNSMSVMAWAAESNTAKERPPNENWMVNL